MIKYYQEIAMHFSPVYPKHSKPQNSHELKGAIHLRKLRITAFSFFILMAPVISIVDLIIQSESFISVFVVISMFLNLILFLWFGFSPCPRCNETFTMKGLFQNGFTSKCLHCGLSIRKKDLRNLSIKLEE